VRSAEESSQEDCLPFTLDDYSSGPDGSPSFSKRSPIRSTYGFSLDANVDKKAVYNTSNNMDLSSKYSSARQNSENTGVRIGNRRTLEGNLKESLKSMDHRTRSRGTFGSHVYIFFFNMG